MANVKIPVPMFKGINIFGEEVVGQLIVVDDTACIVPLNDPNDWNKNFLTFDGHHLTQGQHDSALWIRDPSTIQPAGHVDVEVC